MSKRPLKYPWNRAQLKMIRPGQSRYPGWNVHIPGGGGGVLDPCLGIGVPLGV